MILLVAVVLGLVATVVRARVTRRTLKYPGLRLEWLLILAVIPQLLAFQFPAISRLMSDRMASSILVASQVIMLAFAWVNWRQPGFWLLGLGLIVNLATILSNGGWMPISPDTLHQMFPNRPIEAWSVGQRLTSTKDWILNPADIRLWWFSDRLTLPQWIPYKVAFSMGDILIATGAFYLLWYLSNPKQENK